MTLSSHRPFPKRNLWPVFQSVFNQTGETTIEVDPAQLGSPNFFRAEGD